jgi:hypothetical protein
MYINLHDWVLNEIFIVRSSDLHELNKMLSCFNYRVTLAAFGILFIAVTARLIGYMPENK